MVVVAVGVVVGVVVGVGVGVVVVIVSLMSALWQGPKRREASEKPKLTHSIKRRGVRI